MANKLENVSNKPDILRYHLQVDLPTHAIELGRAASFKDEMLSFLGQDFHNKVAPLRLDSNQLMLLKDLHRFHKLGYVQLKQVITLIHGGRYPMLIPEWIGIDGIERQGLQAYYQLRDDKFSLMTRWGVHPENLPAFCLFGEGLQMMTPDIDFLCFPRIPTSPEEAKEYYSRSFTPNSQNPVFITFDNWRNMLIDWRDKEPQEQCVRFQRLSFIGELPSITVGRTLQVYGTQDILGLRRRAEYYKNQLQRL